MSDAVSPHPDFIEVTAHGLGAVAAPSPTLIEVERPDGARRRLQDQHAPSLATGLRAFLEEGPGCN